MHSKHGNDIANQLPFSDFGPDTSEVNLKCLLEDEKMREQSGVKMPRQNGEYQLRLVALWIDGDKDTRLGRFEHLLQYVSFGTIHTILREYDL